MPSIKKPSKQPAGAPEKARFRTVRPAPRALLLRTALVVLSCAVITAAAVPFKFNRHIGHQAQFHYASHLAVFLTAAILSFAQAESVKSRWICFTWLFCLAFLSECLETAVYRNAFEWTDITLDLSGAAIGGLLLFAVNRRRRDTELAAGAPGRIPELRRTAPQVRERPNCTHP